MKKWIAGFMAVVMMITATLLPTTASASDPPAGEYGVNYIKYGDANGDEEVDAKDALSILKNAVGKEEYNDVKKEVADVNDDTAIDAKDALAVLKFAVGNLDTFTPGEYYVLSVPVDTAVANVETLINALPSPEAVAATDETAITEARTAYDGLTAEQKAHVDPAVLDKLINVETAFAALTGNYIMGYNKSTVVNGAYTADLTADTSYQIDVSSLQPNTVYRLSPPVATTDVDRGRLIYSLQGLINREFGMDEEHSVLLFMPKDSSDNDWYKYVKTDNEDSIFTNMEEIRIKTWKEFLEYFTPVLKESGLVLWDGNVPATSNVAATICGLDGYLPVLAKSTLANDLAALGVETKLDLTGMFKNGGTGNIADTTIATTGSAKNDAYLWALEKYFDRCSSQYLAYTLDGGCTITAERYPGVYADNPTALLTSNALNCIENMDYFIARRCFVYDLAVYKGEAACDDPAQKNGQAAKGLDNQTMLKILEKRYQRAGGAFGQLLGFPPWWVKYTKHEGQGTQHETFIEWLFCEYITCYNMAKEADAAEPASMTNGSFYYKYVPAKSEYKNNKTTKDISYDPNTHYYAIYVGDYDSSAWLKKHIHAMWMEDGGDKNRGQVDMMWSINPNLSYRVPMVFDYMYANLTDRDYMAAGDGGAGYIFPSALYQGKTLPYAGTTRPTATGNGADAWVQYSKTFYERFDLDITGFIINGNSPIDRDVMKVYNQLSPVGNFTDRSDQRIAKYSGTAMVWAHNQITADTPSSTLYSHSFGSMSGYNFSAFRTICQTPTQIKTIVDNYAAYAAGQGKKVQYCDPYTYFKLLKESGQGVNL